MTDHYDSRGHLMDEPGNEPDELGYTVEEVAELVHDHQIEVKALQSQLNQVSYDIAVYFGYLGDVAGEDLNDNSLSRLLKIAASYRAVVAKEGK